MAVHAVGAVEAGAGTGAAADCLVVAEVVVAEQKGVEGVLRGFQDEVERAMALCGARSVDEIDASLLARPTAGA